MPLTHHRLASQIEETPNIESGNWNKVTVYLPNSTYVLSIVELQNNQLSIVFDFTDNATYEPTEFVFLLSGFGIDTNQINKNTKFFVIAIDKLSDLERGNEKFSQIDWYETSGNQYSKSYIFEDQKGSDLLKKYKCPPYCQPPPVND